jgi:hypothetical protein
MDEITLAAVEYVRLSLEGGMSDAAPDSVPSNAQEAAFRALVGALRAAGHVPAYGQPTTDWVRGL